LPPAAAVLPAGFATLLFGTSPHIGALPIIELGDIYISYARLLAFAMALVGAVALYFFLGEPSSGLRSARSPGPRHRRPDGRRQRASTSSLRRSAERWGLAACLLSLQYDVHSLSEIRSDPHL